MEKKEKNEKTEETAQNVKILRAVYDDGENISSKKAPKKPFDGFPMPRD